jgi:HD-GYP domain-containing protein (c-di-GMP phosphodiesterase class II)
VVSDKEPLNASELPNFAPKFYTIGVIIAVIVICGFWLIARFTAADLARDMRTWQEKLNLIADSRTSDVGGWVSGHFKNLRALGDNPSLQLYLSEVSGGTTSESGQKGYLRNLILFTASQTGFGTPSQTPVDANVPSENKNALAIIAGNQIIVSTAMPPALAEMILQKAAKQPKGQEYLIDIQKGADGTPYIGFVAPVFSIQGDRSPNSQIGQVVGIKALDDNFFSMLKHPGTTEKTLESILVRRTDNKIDYLSPLQDAAGALDKQADVDDAHNAESMLTNSIGDFSGDLKDYRDTKVLATSHAVPGTPWTLIVKIDRQEALAESAERRTGMVMMFVLILAIVALILATVWWHANSKRAMLMSRHFRRLAAQTYAQEQLLRLVTDHQPEPTYIIDTHYNYQFANQKAAEDAHMAVSAIPGKPLSDVRGTSRAGYIEKQCEKAMESNSILYDVFHLPTDKGDRIIRSAFVPLAHIPVASLPKHTPGVLVVEQDITEVVHERERRLSTQNHLIQTLVKLVDKRDPFAANHSILVSKLAYQIATDMQLQPALIEATRIAGSLMNIGKILVPSELLTKTGQLSSAEKQTLQDSMNAAAKLLENIDFDGPVAQTLQQWQEKWDGTGPLNMRGEYILISARIIAVVNAFIGMVSPRSWRTAIPIESATKFLIDQADTQFDRKVVIALMNYVENKNGRTWIEKILSEKRAA